MTAARYQPGGDLFAQIAADYGAAAAARVAEAARSGDVDVVNRALSAARRGELGTPEALNESTAALFWQQITTNPLSAPLDSLNKQLGLAVWNVFKNPFVLVLVVAVVFYLLGGVGWVKRKLL